MIPAALLHSLRACQTRSAEEQRLLSGRGWLLIAGAAQVLTTLHPLNQYLLARTLNDHAPMFRQFPWLIGGMAGLGFAFLLLWWWAAYAPFRAALTALLLYLAFHTAVALAVPQVVLDSIASKILVLLGLLLAVRVGWMRHRAS